MSPRQMHEVAPPQERAVMVAAPRKGTSEARLVHEHLDELQRLADTAGAAIVGRMVQVVPKPSNDFYLGKGKVEELKGQLGEQGATIVFFDEELSPAQGKNLEEELKVRIMDRTEVILDIFALRARSKEARMQVELAQLEYLLPRLARMWTHLSRIRGGIGLRGPGETQIETDRRMIRQKISLLKKKLAEVQAHRERVRSRTHERGVLSVALVGYTNAGKSSLLRALTRTDAHVEDRLFATLDTQSRETVLPANGESGIANRPLKVRFTDTVGFIRKLPHGLVASFRATLEEALDSSLLLHVVDVSHNDWREQAETVLETLAEAGVGPEKPMVVALNKVDRLDSPEAERRLREATDMGFDAVLTSSATGSGLDDLRARIALVRDPGHTPVQRDANPLD